MIATNDMWYDGQFYRRGETVWDLGSLVCVSVTGDNVRNYEGYSSDKDKLPHYAGTGSSCLMHDTAQLFKYHKPSDKWTEM